MFLQALHLFHFRNYEDQHIRFCAPKTIVVGENAQGKSNLLESVELLSTLRSHRVSHDRDLVKTGSEMGQVQAQLERSGATIDLGLTFRVTGRRSAVVNHETLRRQFDFLGNVNTVQFSSLDLDLIRGGPAQRRQWLDNLLVQLEPYSAHLLTQYQDILRQRNALLKKLRQSSDRLRSAEQNTELAIWDAQLAAAGTRVMRRRARALARLFPLAQVWHRLISGERETLVVRYLPQVGSNCPDRWDDATYLHDRFLDAIQDRAIAEQHQGTSLVGPHRDEVELTINGTPARQHGSQGQQRTTVLALKLAELQLIDEVIQDPPLLLLDDVLAELDLHRQCQLLEAIHDRFQTLITTTHLQIFDPLWLRSSQIISIQNGAVQESFP
ncbi:MAG: DNA replication/repair protein RecF [Prochlorotrichaceae cyanobacterium]|jgi:DNA replication and repair protein RecF